MSEPPDVPMQDSSHDSLISCPCSSQAPPEPPHHYPSPTNPDEIAETPFQLQPCLYNANELVDWTRQLWDDQGFQSYCKPHIDAIIRDLGPKFRSKSMPKVPRDTGAWKDTAQCHKFVHDMFHALDNCFFFGTMSRPFGNRTYCLVDLVIERKPGKLTKDKKMVFGHEQIIEDEKKRHSRITLFPRPTEKKTRSLANIIETLVHEMIHAYLDLFTCREDECTKNADRIHGFTGHGTLFMLLQGRTTSIIRGWSPKLATYIEGADQAHKPLIHIHSLAEELVAFHKWKLEASNKRKLENPGSSDDEDMDMEPFVPKDCARLSGFEVEYAHIKKSVEICEEMFKLLMVGNRGKKPPQVQKGPKVSGTKPIPFKGMPPKDKRPGGAGR